MVRFWLPPTMALVTMFSVLIMLPGRQPYHNAALQDLLDDSLTCGAACWAGIQPGATGLYNAIDILQRHDWVTEIEFSATNLPDSGFLVWHWNTPPANIIDPARPGVAGIHRGIITWLQIPTAFALGDVWLANGQPAKAVTHTARTAQTSVQHYMTYGEQSVQWRSAIICPWQARNFWQARLDLWLGRPSVVEMPAYIRPTRAACHRG